ncbi:MAG: pilin [Patescibacteria group bacterium]
MKIMNNQKIAILHHNKYLFLINNYLLLSIALMVMVSIVALPKSLYADVSSENTTNQEVDYHEVVPALDDYFWSWDILPSEVDKDDLDTFLENGISGDQIGVVKKQLLPIKPASYTGTLTSYMMSQCLLEKSQYPSAGNCYIACTRTATDSDWVSGSQCEGKSPKGYYFFYVESLGSRVVVEDTLIGQAGANLASYIIDNEVEAKCFKDDLSTGKTAREQCEEAMAPYKDWIPETTNSMSDNFAGTGWDWFDNLTTIVRPFSSSVSFRCTELGEDNFFNNYDVGDYCFNYAARNSDARIDINVGTGDTCFYSEDRCILTVATAYAGLVIVNEDGEEIPVNRTIRNSDYCRADKDDAGREVYCMNDRGIPIQNANPINEALYQDQYEQWQAQVQAHTAAVDAYEAAGTQALKEAGALVPCMGTDCGWKELIDLINRIIRFMITIAAVLLVLMIIYAGFQLVSARGNAAALTKAKSALWKAIAGFVLVLTAWLIVNAVVSLILKDEFKDDPNVNILKN